MTKPFQSIRQLFGRVLGGNTEVKDTTPREYSTLGIGRPEPQPSTNGNGQSNGFAVENSQPDLEAQTADTQRLPQVAPELLDSRNGRASRPQVAREESADEFGDSLLDLGDVRGVKALAADDPLLDILDEAAPQNEVFVEAIQEAPAPAEDSMPVTNALAEDSSDAAAAVPVFEESQWSVEPEAVAVEAAPPESKAEESAPASNKTSANPSDLSPEAIDAIAQRVVAQLSDKVVREIAWEVVPELSELLIKQKLEEK